VLAYATAKSAQNGFKMSTILLDRFGVCPHGLRNMANMNALGPLWLILHEMNNAAWHGREM
jgi:hypothetical protein